MRFLFLKKENLKIPEEFAKIIDHFDIELVDFKEFANSGRLRKEEFSGILVLGGDGTFLRAVPLAYQLDLPIVGVNMGKFGFLTEITLSELPLLFDLWQKGEIGFEERTLLEVQYQEQTCVVLNEAALLKGPLGKIITLKVTIMGEDFIDVYGDGLIISTPTGSTAYNLSAGGPVVHPNIKAFILTPICSFKINHKPFLIPEDFLIEIRVSGAKEEIHLLLDGQENWFIAPESTVYFKKAEKFLKLIPSPSKTYFRILKEKFNW
ncbi:MAG: NAD(+)/NADH kinase [Caldimicrobium sp.]